MIGSARSTFHILRIFSIGNNCWFSNKVSGITVSEFRLSFLNPLLFSIFDSFIAPLYFSSRRRVEINFQSKFPKQISLFSTLRD